MARKIPLKIGRNQWYQWYVPTPWKINMEPKNAGLEDEFPLQLGDFLFSVVFFAIDMQHHGTNKSIFAQNVLQLWDLNIYLK